MKKINSFDQAVDYLYGLRLSGMKLGLENTKILASKFRLPDISMKYIHVAGTNGKGSTCALLESIYRTAGYRTGLFTSPHLIHFNERIRVGGTPIEKNQIIELTQKIADLIGEDQRNDHSGAQRPTFFEATTVMALKAFSEHKVDLAIMETGLGGRLDATNIINPQLCIITSIALDHQKWLGETLGQIAFEKAGIIKAETPVLCCEMENEIMDVIMKKAEEMNAPLHIISHQEIKDSAEKRNTTKLCGAHQNINMALAEKATHILRSNLPCREEDIVKGLESTFWPARLQRIQLNNGGIITLDGAHNPQGMTALASYLKSKSPGKKHKFLLGLLSDRPIEEMLYPLRDIAESIMFSKPPTERAFPLDQITKEAKNFFGSKVMISKSGEPVEYIIESSKVSDLIVAGSLHFAGFILKGLGIDPFDQKDPSSINEQSLNEWHA